MVDYNCRDFFSGILMCWVFLKLLPTVFRNSNTFSNLSIKIWKNFLFGIKFGSFQRLSNELESIHQVSTQRSSWNLTRWSIGNSINFDSNFSPDTTQMAVIRCPSMTRTLGSELSTSCGSLSLSTRRPRSCNASSESLPICLPSALKVENFFCCPAGENCFDEKLTSAGLSAHIQEVHQLATISFGCASAELSLPPRAPIENASLILLLDGKQFWVKIANL